MGSSAQRFITAGWLLAVLAAGSHVAAQEKEREEQKPRTVDIEALWKQRLEPPDVNGVRLGISRPVAEINGASHRIIVSWGIQYFGPRPPLMILAPTLTRPIDGETVVEVYATGKSGKTYLWTTKSPGANGKAAPKEWFLTVDRMTSGANGELQIVTADVKRYFRKVLPEEFDEDKAPKLHIGLIHVPNDRGVDLKLDAWTGRLVSNLNDLLLEEW